MRHPLYRCPAGSSQKDRSTIYLKLESFLFRFGILEYDLDISNAYIQRTLVDYLLFYPEIYLQIV